MTAADSDIPELNEDARAIAEEVTVLLSPLGLYMDPNEPEHRICGAQCHTGFPGCLGWCGK